MIKQTQTKFFRASDVGLDFSPGSKNLMPERFKCMLANGYNSRTVQSFTVTPNPSPATDFTVVFTYDVAHGYRADQVLEIANPTILGEWYVDSVTANTVTFTRPTDPTAQLTGTITSKVASLGWQLVYETTGNLAVQLYKFKDYHDESDLYARFLFSNGGGAIRSGIAPCVGRTANEATGAITDTNAYTPNQSITTFGTTTTGRWDFSGNNVTTYDSWTFADGNTTFGDMIIVGSKYHLVTANNNFSTNNDGLVYGIFPTTLNVYYPNFSLPMLLMYSQTAINTADSSIILTNGSDGIFMCGNLRVSCSPIQTTTRNFSVIGLILNAQAALSATVDSANSSITPAKPLMIFEQSTGQFLGFLLSMGQTDYTSTVQPSIAKTATPSLTADQDLQNFTVQHYISGGSAADQRAFLSIPITPIKP